ncbi:biotin-dependent carboxyltransferase family protein [Neobacillus vireti]|uniref:5-oxoprolinase subunit C family protein n=1 Tax=Neobacillus vireti TaxID=220686 RepID=UPI002FFFDBB1
MKAILKVWKPGLQTTVQDLGRYGYQQFGISPSGAMDTYSMQVANILVGNHNGEAVLEAAIIGPQVEAISDVAIAICGGDFTPHVDGAEVPMWKSFLLRKGQVLTVGHCQRGARAYIAIGGGIEVPFVLGSKSTFLNGKFGGLEGRALQKGDVLAGSPLIRKPYKMLHPELVPHYTKEMTIRVVIGPHENRFTEESIYRFLSEKFMVTHQANRMGYQLKGPKLEHIGGPDIISDPIPLGGIQVPASGQPIILLADRQTTGGYTRIGTVISVDIPRVAQAVPDSILHFSMVSVEEAQQHYLERQRLLRHLQLGVAK